MEDQVKVLRRRKYSIDKINFIRQALAGYVGDSAIANEMVQNADDASASCISFHFHLDALVVRNDSIFTEQDFDNITYIASGGKRAEEGKIGTWGTGFLSVFHLTDAPQLLSAGEHIVFDPTKDELLVREATVRDRTEFRLPWRRRTTELGRRLEADTWSDEAVQRLKDELITDIYRLVIFLRHVNVIKIYEGDADAKLICRVERRQVEAQEFSEFTRERWDIEYRRAGVQPRTDTWLYYRGQVPRHFGVEGSTIKDFGIALAFPLQNRGWLDENVSGALYNFLPTPIQTGYAFQINGAFFPDSNRRSILSDQFTQREKSLWNKRVLHVLGNLFTETILDIRDQVKEPRRFYELLPIHGPSDSFLVPIHEAFREVASDLPIVFTSLGAWQRPDEVLVGLPGSRLPALAADYLPVLPSAPQAFRDFLTDVLEAPRLTWFHVVKHLKPQLQAGQHLVDAHPMINSREKLQQLYHELPSSPSPEQQHVLGAIALCLADDKALWPFDTEIWRADGSTRRLLANTGIRFVDADMQGQFPRLFESLVPEFQGADLVNWLARQEWPATAFPLEAAPAILGDADHLVNLLQFISDDLREVNSETLARLPLVRTENDYLLCGYEAVYWHDDLDERVMLRDLGLAFAHPAWADDEDGIRAVYRRAGVRDLHPRHVIAALQRDFPDWHELPHAELVQQLLALYRYFSPQSHQLAPADKEALRRLPLCLTQQERLAPAKGAGVSLHLPPVKRLGDGRALTHLDKLQLDYLIHSDLIAHGGGPFLTQVLGLTALSPAELIRTVILPNYDDSRLDDAARQDLLQYISEQMRSLGEGKQRELWPELFQAPLVRCEDGVYRRGKEVYFASPALDAVFIAGYHRLHPDYDVPLAQSGDDDHTPYRRSTWYWLFEGLGVNEHPTPADLVQAVERVVTAGPPTDERVDAVRRIYNLLRERVGTQYSIEDPDLLRLRELEWLPASEDSKRWHKPPQIYPPRFSQLIGSQAPILRFPEQQNTNQLLELPANAPISLVVAHLRDTASKNQPVHPGIYAYLGTHFDEIPQDLQSTLKAEAIVWDNTAARFWPARHVFLENHSHLFGARRCCLRSPGGDAQTFLEKIGVRERPDPWDDSIDLLREITADYADGSPLSEEDRRLLLANFDHLGRQMPASGDAARSKLGVLRQLAGVPGQDGQLYAPNRIVLVDQHDILDQFDDDAFPIVDETELTEAGYRFLRTSGVRRLSEIVQRRPVNTKGSREDEHFSLRLRQLADAFQRIALTVREQQGDHVGVDLPASRLAHVRLRVCDRLEVAYMLDNGQGWQVQGYRRPEQALYAPEYNILYVKQATDDHSIPPIPVARELEQALFPGSKESIVIEQLLRMRLSEVQGYLDEHGYRPLYQEQVEYRDRDSDDEELVDWGEADDSLPPWEQEYVEEPMSVDESDSEAEQLELTGRESPDGIPSIDLPSVPTDRQKEKRGDDIDVDEGIPVFTGQRRPAVPVLPNNYGELTERFGLTRPADSPGTQISTDDSVGADSEWERDKQDQDEGERNAGRVSHVRFTLTFTNRYEGFLPLHYRARQMLVDEPRRLRCQTDFEEWTFDLYVDYAEDIIYNQEMLPRFFEAHNIPAGGIVYLELVHGSTVRLYWKSTTSRVENVRCLELLEDGTLEEYEVPAAEFPCEIAEYVLRAEKRLEDTGALFKQAMDKRGIFQTICEVFAEPGRELSYDEIYEGVMAQRMVAKASIDHQLSQRPCFVRVDDNRWRFEPDRGSEPTQTPRLCEGRRRERQRRTSTGEDGQDWRDKPFRELSLEASSPYHQVLAHVEREWRSLDDLLQPNGRNLREQLQHLAERLVALAQRLQSDLAMLDQTEDATDDLLISLWQSVGEQPENRQLQRDLVQYLWQGTTQGNQEKLLAQVRRQLADIPHGHREVAFFPLLSQLADRAVREGHLDLARDLYRLLQQQGAGDFQSQLARLSQYEGVQEYIDLVQLAKTPTERWELWQDAWEEYQGFPTLRQAIQKEIESTMIEVRRQIDLCLQDGNLEGASDTYIGWISIIHPLADAWHTASIASEVWELVQQIFEAWIQQARESDGHVPAYRRALEVAATLPLNAHKILSGDTYLEAVQAVAEGLEEQSDDVAAAGLLEYGVHVVDNSQQPVADYVLYKAHEHAGRLYEHQELFDQAYEHLHRAQQRASDEQRKLLSHRLHGLRQKRNVGASVEIGQRWQFEVEAFLDNPKLCCMVNPSLFRQLLVTVH